MTPKPDTSQTASCILGILQEMPPLRNVTIILKDTSRVSNQVPIIKKLKHFAAARHHLDQLCSSCSTYRVPG
jgi:hypothetical protein